VSSRWRLFQLLLLAASTWAVTYARYALGPLQEAIRVDLALTDNQMAWLQGPALALPMALGAIPFGLYVDRFPRAPLFLAGAGLILAATVASAFAPSYPFLIAARCVVGLAFAAVIVAAYSAVADLYAVAQRGRATMVVCMGEITAPPAAFAVGGVLLTLVVVGQEGWRSALLWMCTPLLFAALLLLLLRELPRTDVVVENAPLRVAWRGLWGYRGVVVPLMFARIMVWIADGAVVVWAIPSFARSFAMQPERVSVIMASALLVCGVLGPVLGGPLADICQRSGGPRRTVTALLVLAVLSVPAALFAIMPNASVAGMVLTLFLTLGATFGVAAMTLATIVIPGELRGLYVAVSVVAGATFSIGLAPVVVSALSAVLGGPARIGLALAIVCGSTTLISVVALGWGRRYFPSAGGRSSPPATAYFTMGRED